MLTSCLRPGTRSDFESPSKSISTANIPQLRPAAGQTTFLSRFSSSPDKPLPPPPSKEIDIAAFRTPSKAPAFDFTSGDDTPEEKSLKRGPGGFHVSDTPDADSEATPEQIYQRNARSRIDTSPSKTIQDAKRDRTRSPKKRTSLLTKLWSSPSRGKDMLTPYSNKVEKRIQRKRAEKTRIKNTRSNTYNSDSETDASRRKDTQDKKASGPVHGFMTSWLGLIENHPNAPSILITYLQLLTNFIFMCVILYGAWSFWMTIKRDVDQGVHEAASAVLIEVRQCKDDWEQFRCEARPERTRELCDGLAKCLAKNPEQIARAQVSAKTFAKIANDFAEHLSYKAVVSSSSDREYMRSIADLNTARLRHGFLLSLVLYEFHVEQSPQSHCTKSCAATTFELLRSSCDSFPPCKSRSITVRHTISAQCFL